MTISIGLVNRPSSANTKAAPWPMRPAMRVASACGRRMARRARSTRPPSIGKAGIRLNTTRKMLAAASRAEHAGARVLEFRQAALSTPVPRMRIRTRRDDDVDGRAGEGHHQFLARLFGNALEAGDAADRPERHVGRADAVAAGGEDMAELVRQDAGKSRRMKSTPSMAASRPPSAPVAAADPDEEEQERDVHAHHRAGDGGDRDGPEHRCLRRTSAASARGNGSATGRPQPR